jgi:hypothetical protein
MYIIVLDKKTVIVDVVIVIQCGLQGWERGEGGLKGKGWAVATRQGTRVDGDLSP